MVQTNNPEIELFGRKTNENDSAAPLWTLATRYCALKDPVIDRKTGRLKLLFIISASTTETVENGAAADIAFCYRINKSYFESEGYESMKNSPYRLEEFLGNGTQIYISSAKKQVCILSEGGATTTMLQKTSAILFRLLPWKFPQTTDRDTRFFRALFEQKYDIAHSLYLEETNDINVRELRLQILADFEKGRAETRTRFINREIEKQQSDIDELEERLSDTYKTLSRLREKLFYLTTQSEADSGDMINFFRAHKTLCITNYSYDADLLTYLIKDTLEYFDTDLAEKLFGDHQTSVFCDHYNIPVQALKDCLYALFVKQTGRLKVQSGFALDMRDCEVGVDSCYSQNELTDQDYLAHPHLYGFKCLGDNKRYIIEALNSGDIELALETTIAATKNIDFGDIAVVRQLIRYFDEGFNTCTCILTDDGESITPMKFLEKIKGEANG